MKIAVFVKELEGYKGDARLYRVSPPMSDQYSGKSSDFVVVSAVNAMFSGPETFIFLADEDGDVIDWGELPGSFQGNLDHIQALNNAGYAALMHEGEDVVQGAVVRHTLELPEGTITVEQPLPSDDQEQ